MKNELAVAFALVLGAAGAVSGKGLATGGAATAAFTKMDKNGDGSLTMNEMKANKELAAQMEKMDKNKDHKLDQEEFGSFATGGDI